MGGYLCSHWRNSAWKWSHTEENRRKRERHKEKSRRRDLMTWFALLDPVKFEAGPITWTSHFQEPMYSLCCLNLIELSFCHFIIERVRTFKNQQFRHIELVALSLALVTTWILTRDRFISFYGHLRINFCIISFSLFASIFYLLLQLHAVRVHKIDWIVNGFDFNLTLGNSYQANIIFFKNYSRVLYQSKWSDRKLWKEF